MAGAYSKLPGGDIKPNTFVKLDPSNTGFVLQCGAGDVVYGITGDSTRRIALDAYDDGLIGKSGDPAIQIRGPGEQPVLLRLGANCNNGDYLKPDANGYGTPATTDKDKYGARALCVGTNGQLIPVEVIIAERSI